MDKEKGSPKHAHYTQQQQAEAVQLWQQAAADAKSAKDQQNARDSKKLNPNGGSALASGSTWASQPKNARRGLRTRHADLEARMAVVEEMLMEGW